MAHQALFYERAVPISSEEHRDVSVSAGGDYRFARGANLVPLVLPELPAASADYPIVFVGKENEQVAAAVLGLSDAQNLFVDAEGKWNANYIPAFVRRYPFVFANASEEGRFLLCVDESAPMVNREGRGERLFDSEGARTSYLDNVLTFMQRYQVAYQRSQEFCRRLNELGLTQQMQAQLRGPDGERQLRGFNAVNRDRLKSLDPEVLKDLLSSDGMEAVFLHLFSLRNLQALAARATPATAAAPAAGALGGELDDEGILLN